MTNGERFRSMTDTELAELLCGFCKNAAYCTYCPFSDGDCPECETASVWLEWIKEETK